MGAGLFNRGNVAYRDDCGSPRSLDLRVIFMIVTRIGHPHQHRGDVKRLAVGSGHRSVRVPPEQVPSPVGVGQGEGDELVSEELVEDALNEARSDVHQPSPQYIAALTRSESPSLSASLQMVPAQTSG